MILPGKTTRNQPGSLALYSNVHRNHLGVFITNTPNHVTQNLWRYGPAPTFQISSDLKSDSEALGLLRPLWCMNSFHKYLWNTY